MAGEILTHLVQDHKLPMPVAKAALAGWELRPIEHRGIQMGELMILQNEVHFALNPAHRKVLGRRQLLSDVLGSLLKEKKFLVTRLYPHSKEVALVKAFGFTKTHSDGKYDYYWMNEGDAIPAGHRTKEVLNDSH